MMRVRPVQQQAVALRGAAASRLRKAQANRAITGEGGQAPSWRTQSASSAAAAAGRTLRRPLPMGISTQTMGATAASQGSWSGRSGAHEGSNGGGEGGEGERRRWALLTTLLGAAVATVISGASLGRGGGQEAAECRGLQESELQHKETQRPVEEKWPLAPPVGVASNVGVSNPHVQLAVSATYAANAPSEDRHDIVETRAGDVIAAVVDGHGGGQCAEFVWRRLAYTLEKEIHNAGEDNLESTKEEGIHKCLARTFMRVERRFLYQVKSAFDVGFGDVARVGACVVMALVRGNTLYVANAGDCRVVLGRRREGGEGEGEEGKTLAIVNSDDEEVEGVASTSTAGTAGTTSSSTALPPPTSLGMTVKKVRMEALPLSRDHSANEAEEQAKLRMLHPNEIDIINCKRPKVCYVKGRLQPTRSLGDAYLKYSEFNASPGGNELLKGSGRYLPAPYTPPYISAEPEIASHKIDPARDEFLIMGSDGVWDYLKNEEAVAVVQGMVEEGRGDQAGDAIVEAVLARAAEKYDLSREELFQLSRGRARRTKHDDITCVVLFLGNARPKQDQATATVSALPTP